MPDTSQPEVKIHDKSSLLSSKTNGTGYNFSKSYRDSRKNKCCTATNAALIFALVLFMFGAGYIAGFFTPMSFKRPNDDSHKRVARNTSPWRTKIADHGTVIYLEDNDKKPTVLHFRVFKNVMDPPLVDIYIVLSR
jgi:hypothetical protein